MIDKEKIQDFLGNEKKFRALVNDEEFIDRVSEGQATTETYKEQFKRFGLEISDDEANLVKDTVNKIFETPSEKLDDEFLKNVAGGGQSDTQASVSATQNGSSSGSGLSLGLGIGIPVAAWLSSGVACAIAASVYRRKKNRDKFHKCATASFHILNAPFLPLEGTALVALGVAAGKSMMMGLPSIGGPSNSDFKNFFTCPVESIFGVDVE